MVPAERRRFDWLWGGLIIVAVTAAPIAGMVIGRSEWRMVLLNGLFAAFLALSVVQRILERKDGRVRWYLSLSAVACVLSGGAVALSISLPRLHTSADFRHHFLVTVLIAGGLGLAGGLWGVLRFRAAQRRPSLPPPSGPS